MLIKRSTIDLEKVEAIPSWAKESSPVPAKKEPAEKEPKTEDKKDKRDGK